MGSWLADQLSPSHEVAVYDVDAKKTEKIVKVKVLSSLSELSDFSPELAINAVTLQNTLAAFEQITPFLPKNCIICDVASIKGQLPSFYAKCGFPFVSLHPMFGPTFANMASLQEENAIIIKESDSKGAKFFSDFFFSLGLHIYYYSFSEHDEMMAYSLTTPFVSSLVFAACVDKTTVPGSTFARHMKIARGLLSEDDSLLCEVLFNLHSLPQLSRITGKLEHLKHIIKAKDYEEAKKFLFRLRKNVNMEE